MSTESTNSVIESRKKAGRPPVTVALAEWIASVRYVDIPADIAAFARRAIADTLGGAIAASREDVTRIAIEVFKDEPGGSIVWGTDVRTTARNAALVNGTMAHAHDIDDNNKSMGGHPSAPVLPAVLALADEIEVTGADIVLAYLVGIEVEGKIGRAVTYEHNGRGWHTTGTLGALGAAAAAAKLLRLDAKQAANALGIAVSMASGVRQNFGTMAKPLHAGTAAQSGLLAAKLAAKGFSGSDKAIEGHEGFFDMFTSAEALKIEAAIDGLGTKFEILQNVPKLYASCALVHTGVDMVLEGLRRGEIDVADIERVTCGVSYHALNLMRYGAPRDPLEARFSYPYCIAAALVFGKLGIAQFADDVVTRADVHDLIRKIDVVILPEFSTQALFQEAYATGRAYSDLEVTHKSGRVFRMRELRQKGHPLKPFSEADYRGKFIECMSLVVPEAAAERAWSRLIAIDEGAGRVRPESMLSISALGG